MNSSPIRDVSLRIKYRPIRIGICINSENIEHVIEAMKVNYTLWGGIFNPIIPINHKRLSDYLIRLFNVDVLYNLYDDKEVNNFIEDYTFLRWPFDYERLFYSSFRGFTASLLDVFYPLKSYSEDSISFGMFRNLKKSISIFNHPENKELDNLCTLTFGKLPNKVITKIDYEELIDNYLNLNQVEIDENIKFDHSLLSHFTLAELSKYNLFADSLQPDGQNGVYFGDLRNSIDLVNCWNLRAAGIKINFYDQNLKNYYGEFIQKFREEGVKHSTPFYSTEFNNFRLYYSNFDSIDLTTTFHNDIKVVVSDEIWNGYNIKPSDHFISSHFLHTTVILNKNNEKYLVNLPEKKFSTSETTNGSNLICEISGINNSYDSFSQTISFPHFPLINNFLGDKCIFEWRNLRTSTSGMRIIADISSKFINVFSVNVTEYAVKMFEAMGIQAEASKAGLIARRIIEQFGGLQGCRIFKIEGVRKLFASNNPEKIMSKTKILEFINEAPLGGKKKNAVNNFSKKYSDLFFEGRSLPQIIPTDVFNYLITNGAFRIGQTFVCEKCNIEFWVELDNINSISNCSYCGHRNDIQIQLTDNNWGYRKSGIFGREDNQEGAIPVVATLQQLDTTVMTEKKLFLPSLKLKIKDMKKELEIDLLCIIQGFNQQPEIVLGECKAAGGEIDKNDIENLIALADKISSQFFKVYILISKMAYFKAEEIELCRQINKGTDFRAILLTHDEVEPYHIYTRTQLKYPQIDKHAISIYQMAVNTHKIYFTNEKN